MRLLTWILVVVSFVGIADASYLAHAAYTGSALNCAILDGCNTVAQSPYSRVFGVPLAYFGLLYYIVALTISASLLSVSGPRMHLAMFLWAIAGVLFSAYFMYLQYFVIEAVCLYCVISATATALLLIFSFLLQRKETI